MLIYSRVNCAFSPIYALSRAHLRNFKTASQAVNFEISEIFNQGVYSAGTEPRPNWCVGQGIKQSLRFGH
jgi:hypothetical protein